MSAQGVASRYTVPTIATLMWLMLCNIFARAVGREIGLGCFLLIINVQTKNVRRFLPDLESLNLLTDLLSTLWPTACKVSLCTGQLPPCLWPSTLVALCEWMQQKKFLSVERLGYLATHSPRRLIRAIQAECLQKEPHVCFGRHMVLQLLVRDHNCRGILVDKRRERFQMRLTRKISTLRKVWQRKMSASQKRTRKNQAGNCEHNAHVV